MKLVKVEIPGHKPVHIDKRVFETRRPKEKPKGVTQEYWEASKCKDSPTGSHYFRPRVKKLKGKPYTIRMGRMRCVFCKRSHSSIYPHVNVVETGIVENGIINGEAEQNDS